MFHIKGRDAQLLLSITTPSGLRALCPFVRHVKNFQRIRTHWCGQLKLPLKCVLKYCLTDYEKWADLSLVEYPAKAWEETDVEVEITHCG